MPYHAAIFDLDGTLLDSIRDIAESMNQTLERLGYPGHSPDQYKIFIGDGIAQLAQRALPENARSDADVACFLASYRIAYDETWNIHSQPYPGIPEMLAELATRNIPMAVLSNKPDAITRKCVDYFFPDVPFRFVAGQRDTVPRKPDPAGAWEAARHMNMETAACVFVGDTSTDMKTATAAGMFPAGVLWGFRPEAELVENGAKLVAMVPRALLGLFG